MKIRQLTYAALGAVALAGVTLTLTLNSSAQGGGPSTSDQFPPPAQAGPRNQGGPGGPPGFGQAPGGQGPGQLQRGQFMGAGGGGGGTAMDSDNSFLYIVQGNMLFKVSKSDLRIIGSTPLMQMPAGGPGLPGEGRSFPGQGGQRPPGGPGGGVGGATVRPPQEG